MTRPIKVNPPIPGMRPHPGFPQGKELDVLVKARDVEVRIYLPQRLPNEKLP